MVLGPTLEFVGLLEEVHFSLASTTSGPFFSPQTQIPASSLCAHMLGPRAVRWPSSRDWSLGNRMSAEAARVWAASSGFISPFLNKLFYFEHFHLPLAAHLSARPACFPVIMIGCGESHSHAIPCATAAPGEKASASPEVMPFSSCLLLQGETPITGCPTAKLSILITVFGRAGKSLWLIVLPHPPIWPMKQPGLREKAGLGREHTANQGQSWH